MVKMVTMMRIQELILLTISLFITDDPWRGHGLVTTQGLAVGQCIFFFVFYFIYGGILVIFVYFVKI
jgi:hypothetical protein